MYFSFTVALLRKRKQNNVSNSSTDSYNFTFPKSDNTIRKPPMVPRNSAVLLKDKFNPEIDLFKGKEIKRTGKTKFDRPPMWDGDENEDFHWHDKRRRRPGPGKSFSVFFQQNHIDSNYTFVRKKI